MKCLTYIIKCLLLLLLITQCSKESIQPLSIEEKLIGTWELREMLNFNTYNDTLWHDVPPPYFKIIFKSNSTFHTEFPLEIYKEEEEQGIYEVRRTGADIGISFKSQTQYGWRIIDFKSNRLTVGLGQGRELEVKIKYYKIE